MTTATPTKPVTAVTPVTAPSAPKFNLSRFHKPFSAPIKGPLPPLSLADEDLTYFWLTREAVYEQAFVFLKKTDPADEQVILNAGILDTDDDGFYCWGDSYPGIVSQSAVKTSQELDHSRYIAELERSHTDNPLQKSVYRAALIEGDPDIPDEDEPLRA